MRVLRRISSHQETARASFRCVVCVEFTEPMTEALGFFSLLGSYWARSNDVEGANTPQYSVPHLRQLHACLSLSLETGAEGNKATDEAGDTLVNTVVQLTEALLWGEKHDTDFFDFFCEAGILGDFVRMLGEASTPQKAKVQLLQTLSMLVQNSRRQTTLYYLLSNHHLNRLISMQLDFCDEEICTYYITFLKSLAIRMNVDTVRFFFIQHPEPSFPLFVDAVKLVGHDDQMVRTAVRTISLQAFRIEDPQVRTFVLNHAANDYFPELACALRDLWLRVDVTAAHATEQSKSKVHSANELQQDLLLYLADILDLEIPELSEALEQNILEHAVNPVLVAALQAPPGPASRSGLRKDGTLSPAVARFLARQVVDTLDSDVLSTPLNAAMEARRPSKVSPVISAARPADEEGKEYSENDSSIRNDQEFSTKYGDYSETTIQSPSVQCLCQPIAAPLAAVACH